MASSAPVLLILGAGPNVGSGVAKAFAAKGYKIASTSRTTRDEAKEDGALHIQSDLSDPDSITGVFQKVTKALGPPSVVVYNASAHTPGNREDPLSLPVKDLNRDLQVNVSSALAAAHEATVAFEKLPSTASRTFIYTGNRLNIAPIGSMLSLGVGKAAAAHLIASASGFYGEKGYKFYYADERKPDGSPAFKISGQAHGEFYIRLAETATELPWLATFVKGAGYVDFSANKA